MQRSASNWNSITITPRRTLGCTPPSHRVGRIALSDRPTDCLADGRTRVCLRGRGRVRVRRNHFNIIVVCGQRRPCSDAANRSRGGGGRERATHVRMRAHRQHCSDGCAGPACDLIYICTRARARAGKDTYTHTIMMWMLCGGRLCKRARART